MKSVLNGEQEDKLVCILENYLKKNKRTYGQGACLGSHYIVKGEFRVPVEGLVKVPGPHKIYSLPGFYFVSEGRENKVYDTRELDAYFAIKIEKSNWWRYIKWFFIFCSIMTLIICLVLIMAHTRNEEDILRPLKDTAKTSHFYSILLYCIQFFCILILK